ncbi:putative phage tail protein [Flavonifractor plautii]|uniref:putative phage tail protein n=1 Tax=Flavonifractor plautii TaxID=292800 RepID=UPI003219F617
MSNLVFRLPRYYQDSPQVSELERVLGEQAGALCVSESDTLAQLWVDTATWGLDLWEQWVGLPADRTRPYSYRRSRIKAKLRGQGATTAEMLRSVVASFGFEPSQISVIEHPAEYQFEIVLSELAGVPADVGGIEAAVNEIKPAHLDYWFTYELAQLLAALRVGGGLWSIQAVTLPPMEEE